MQDKRIAVLGAGPMGLAVAYQLVLDGYHPIIFEADDRVGGMTAMFDFNGLTIERYYHFHCTSDKDFLQILQELNIADKMRWVETKMGYWYQGKLQDWGNPWALLKFQGLSLIAKIRYGLHAFLSTRRQDWQPLDGQEATTWIKRWIGKEAFDVLWRRLFEYKFYYFSENLSAAWIWSRIRRIGRSRYSLFREKLGHLEGGSITLLDAMKTYIETHGGEFRLKQPVTEVCLEDNKVTGVKVSDTFESFDRVISTIPLPYVPKVMPTLPESILNQYRAIKNIAVVCVIAKLKKAVSRNFWVNINDDRMDIPGLVEYSNLRTLSEHVVYVPFYMPGEHEKFSDDNIVFIEKVKTYLKLINPDLMEDDFIDIRASRYRYAQPICPPNYLKNLPPHKLPINGLWVADTSYYYPEDRGISESIGFGRMMAKESILPI
jgi:protoporphyrinogen oxidase